MFGPDKHKHPAEIFKSVFMKVNTAASILRQPLAPVVAAEGAVWRSGG